MIPSEDYLDRLSSDGMALYESKLREILEREHDGEYVAIHVDSGDYAVGGTFVAAARELRKRHEPDGRVFGRRIGNIPDYLLAARILASEHTGGAQSK
jgi:hypothetical protein